VISATAVNVFNFNVIISMIILVEMRRVELILFILQIALRPLTFYIFVVPTLPNGATQLLSLSPQWIDVSMNLFVESHLPQGSAPDVQTRLCKHHWSSFFSVMLY